MRKVVIVGGGSAGWITASYLNGALNDRGQKPTVDITLIESPNVPRISVGEATVPSINHILDVVGINEADFMKATDATFKQSIKFVNWLENDDTGYHHPFSRFVPGPIDRTGQRWMESKRDIPFMETVSAQTVIAEINRSPKTADGRPFNAPLKYAFHFDAQLFADYLSEFSVQRGVNHIRATVIDVTQDDKGWLQSVSLDTEQDIDGDLFVDCTGFKSILMEKAMGVPWEDFSQWLLCDRAITAQFDYDTYFPGVIRPYTTATAQSSGWIWDTPTQTRRAIGYVHASDFIDEDDARKELLTYQGANNGKSFDDHPTRTIHFKVGQRQKAWTKNCLAIGLSGGFIEPLESTGIYMSELAAVMLAEHFPHRDEDMLPMAYRVNRIISNRFYEILDFINMHYCLTRRNDTAFWREVQKPERINDRLKAKLEHWSRKAPTRSDFDDQSFQGFTYGRNIPDDPEIDARPPVDAKGLWDHTSYEAILFGMDFRGHEFEKNMGDTRKSASVVPQILSTVRAAPQALPPHHVWLHHKLGMPAWETGPRPAGWIKHPYS